MPEYTVLTVLAVAGTVALELLVLRTGIFRTVQYWLTMAMRLSDRRVRPSPKPTPASRAVRNWNSRTIATRVKIMPNWRALEVVPPKRFF